MSKEQRNPITLPATADLSASLFCGVAINTSGQLVLPSANGPIVGVLYAAGKGGAFQCEVFTLGEGIIKALYGGTVTANDPLKVTSAGKFVTASASDVAAGFQVAICIKSGALNDIGEIVLLGNTAAAAVVGIETITTGAASLATTDTLLSTTGTIAYSLANGLYAGQQKRFREITAASTPLGTLTIATPFGTEPATHVFTATGQELVLEWTGAAWHVISKIRAGAETVVVGTTVLTGHDMCLVYNLSVTGTVHSTSTMGIPNCYLSGDYFYVRTTVAASTPVGDINIAGFTKAEVAATSLAAINATTCTAQFLGGSDGWHNVNVTTATYS